MIAGNVHTIEIEVGGGTTAEELHAARATLAVTLAAAEVARLNLKLVEAEQAGSQLVPDLEERLVQAEAELVAAEVEAERRQTRPTPPRSLRTRDACTQEVRPRGRLRVVVLAAI